MKDKFSQRKNVIKIIVITVFCIYWGRLFYIQIIDKRYSEYAENQAFRNITQYPARGLIYDRNGKLIVYNEPVYDLMVVPDDVNNLDTAELCDLVAIDRETFNTNFQKARKTPKTPSIFVRQLSVETYGRLQERLYKFHGFYVQPRTLRKYPRPIAAHVLGYIGEVDKQMIKENPYYKSGDYIGMSGLEEYYE